MTLAQVWGSLVIFLVCPILGGLPLIDWITYGITGRQLAKLGTGNISVSAAFYHGGRLAGILAVLSEAAKGIIAVLLTRAFFPSNSVWEIIALIALVIGRYWMGKGAGTTNVVWGIVVHDAIAAFLVFLIGGISFTIFRNRVAGKFSVLVLMAVIIGLRNPSQPEYLLAASGLASLLAWIYQQIPDDLDLATAQGQTDSRAMFRFFRGDRNIISLDKKLDARKVGQKAANLSLLTRLGYPVPQGWVLPPGDDPASLIEFLQPFFTEPLVVRSSAIGEDTETASAAGQYLSVLNIASREALKTAIFDCQASYLQSAAVEYRRHRQQQDKSMAVLIQKQIKGVFAGVAFSRDPLAGFGDAVVIEALPGDTPQVVSGRVTPQRYQVIVPELRDSIEQDKQSLTITQEDSNSAAADIPAELLQSVALLVREMEELFQGVPQDLEWTYDGEKLWLLQVRPITTLQPIWTRKIAAEVIPGLIRPLTWSINQPLTCGVWGELFTLVLDKRARGLDFNQTAALHFSRAYFNATLLGQIFLRMGLPPESLEFLTRGEKFSKPPLKSTLRNIPGLWRLLQREWNLIKDFEGDRQKLFAPTLTELKVQPVTELSSEEILDRVEMILVVLERATYYSILAPLSLALRQAIFKVSETELDNSQTPEVESMRSLACLATDTRKLLTTEQITLDSSASLFAHIAENPEGESILKRFNQWLERYGYLSEVATDIAISRWQDNPRPVREMFTRFFFDREAAKQTQSSSTPQSIDWRTKFVQERLNLKGQVSKYYSQLLAHLRWSFLALAKHWLNSGLLTTTESIFLLDLPQIRRLVTDPNDELREQLPHLIAQRQEELEQNQQLTSVPYVVYGYPSPLSLLSAKSSLPKSSLLKGIGTSPGQIEGYIKVLLNFDAATNIDKQTIIVVPHTDAGWTPLLASAGGLIAEAGGRLSHGAIVAREYGIPAVMNIPHATELLKDGQRVRLDGKVGLVEILAE
ncbi:glycerol-3-phosphate acyltransferase [Pleurocapsales cyanobacterium LEGE 06147]|nr:glycerol-3-phosphate acyltransferase [Pleurocapsales cyanobacterium LEGE 06147]